MGITSERTETAVSVVSMDFPPVNAPPVRGWFELAEAITAAGADQETHAVVLRAEGRGFCAGVDIKEIQRDDGYDSLIGANRGCYAAFAAVYECPVPVVTAVGGFCLGGGIGLVGNSDVIVAAEDANFGLPEVDRGALGAATHLSRLVPQHLMRALFYTGRTVSAASLHHYGSVFELTTRERLDSVALGIAEEIAAKDNRTIRMAKEALNGIDPGRVHRDYRFEQGFTFELNLTGASDAARQSFVDRKEH